MQLIKLNPINFTFSKSRVFFFQKGQIILIKGPLGLVNLILPPKFKLNYLDSCHVYLSSTSKLIALQKTYSQLLIQKIRGVTLGFFEILVICGIGWKFTMNGQHMVLSLGFSHTITYKVLLGVEITSLDSTGQRFKVFSLNFSEVQHVVSHLVKLRLFNLYTGKGIYKDGANIKLKTRLKSKS